MTLKEYDKQMGIYSDRIRENYTEELYKELSEFQYDYMEKVLKEYKSAVGGDPARRVCYELLEYAVNESQSGNAIVEVDYISTDDEAELLQDRILEEIGDYLLDDCQVYQEHNGTWVADVMFGGSYVPYWDGWREE